MRYVLFPLLILALMIVPAASASAQSAPVPSELLEEPAPPTTQEPETLEPEPFLIPGMQVDKLNLPFDDYSDIPPEALAEMQNFYEDCQKNKMLSSHYNCECWSARFLEERIRIGPIRPRMSVMLTITSECFNIPGAAGYALEKCQGYGSASYDGGMSPEEYCQCIANNYAIQLDRMEGQQLTRNRSNSMMTSSILRCKTPQNPGDRNIFRRLDQ